MDTENATVSEPVVDHKTALIQKGVILGAAAVGILISVSSLFAKKTPDTFEPIEVVIVPDETPES